MSTQTDKIIYQYKLLKKVRRRRLIGLLYVCLLLAWLLFTLQLGEGVLPAMVAMTAGAVWHGIYFAVTRLLLARERDGAPDDPRYGWCFAWPWCGYLPTATVPFRQFRAIQLHILIVGLLLSAAAAVWVPPVSAVTLSIVHLWWMLPRITLVVMMQRSARSGSLLTLTNADAALYAP